MKPVRERIYIAVPREDGFVTVSHIAADVELPDGAREITLAEAEVISRQNDAWETARSAPKP